MMDARRVTNIIFGPFDVSRNWTKLEHEEPVSWCLRDSLAKMEVHSDLTTLWKILLYDNVFYRFWLHKFCIRVLIFIALISNDIKATVLGSVLSIGTLKHSFLKFYAQQNLVNLVLTRYYLSRLYMYILVYYHLYLHQD